MRFFKFFIYFVLGLLLIFYIAKIQYNPYYNESKSHHTKMGFINNYPIPPKELSFLSWMWQKITIKKDTTIFKPTPRTEVDLDFLKNNRGQNAAIWIGHSTTLIQTQGYSVLTDPIWSERASPVSFAGPKRYSAPAMPIEDLPAIDFVLISHTHYDHLDLSSIRFLMKNHPNINFLVPLGVERWFEENVEGTSLEGDSQNVFALDWWDTLSFASQGRNKIQFDFLPVQHWSMRWPHDRGKNLWGSWALLASNFKFWFSGDLGMSKDIEDISKKYDGFDLAAIAIGAYSPRGFMKNFHINPKEALLIANKLNVKNAFGIHWGTFPLTDEPYDEPPKKLKEALSETNSEINFETYPLGYIKVF